MANQPTLTIINQADENYCLAIRGSKVVLAPVHSDDLYQQWMRYNTGAAGAEGQPAFAIVNKATNEAIKHDEGSGTPMSLVPYDASSKDDSIFFTESKQDGSIMDLYTGTNTSERWKFAQSNPDHSNPKPSNEDHSNPKTRSLKIM